MINDLIEELCGARLTYNYMRIGGVAWDLPPGFRKKVARYLEHLEPCIHEINDLLSYGKIYTERLGGVAVVSPAMAMSYGLVGPNLRASGLKHDLRKDRPYSVYGDFEFDVPVGHGEMGGVGDCWDRYMMRIWEIFESIKIPEGPVVAKVARTFKPPAGDVHVRVEAARGDMSWYCVSDGSEYPYRVHVRTGSFAAISIIEELSKGLMIADLVAVIATFDIVAPEVDR